MQTIKLNLIPQGVNPTCYSSQYDVGRVIRVLLFEGVTPYTLSNSESVSLSVRKPDNTLVTTSVVNTGAEYVDIVTTEQMTAVTGINICELRITEGSKVIGSLNFNMQVELDPTANGIPSGSALDNLQEQVNACVEVALEELYDGSSVSFDTTPTADHDAPYTVTSAGIKTALDNKANSSDLNNYYNKTQIDNALAGLTASNIGYDNSNTGLTADDTQEAIDEVLSKVPVNASALSYSNTLSGLEADNVQNAIDEVLADVPTNASELSYSNTQSGLTADDVQEAIDELASQSTDVSFTSNQNDGNKIGELTIDGVTTDLYTGELSTVGALDDLSDVDTTGKATGDSLRYNGLEWVAKPTVVEMTQAEYNLIVDFTPYENTHIVITDAPNLNPTASDIEYSSGVSVKQAIDSKVNNSMTATTDTANGKRLSGGYIQIGNIVFVDINVELLASTDYTKALQTGLPTPIDNKNVQIIGNNYDTWDYQPNAVLYGFRLANGGVYHNVNSPMASGTKLHIFGSYICES